MDWLEIDGIVVGALAFALFYWLVRVATAFLNAQSILPDSLAHGILNFIP